MPFPRNKREGVGGGGGWEGVIYLNAVCETGAYETTISEKTRVAKSLLKLLRTNPSSAQVEALD